MTTEDSIATAADFRALAETRATQEFEPPQRVVLQSSGLAVMLRRPTTAYFALRGLPLPQSVAAASAQERGAGFTPATGEFASRMVDLLKLAFVSPRLALEPGPDEISPNWIDQQDMIFLFKYLVGEVLWGGQDLRTFRGEREPGAAACEDGGAMALPSERAASISQL